MGKKKNKLKRKQAISKHSYDKHTDCVDFIVNKLLKKKGIEVLEIECEYPNSVCPIGEVDILYVNSTNHLIYTEIKGHYSSSSYSKGKSQTKRWIDRIVNNPGRNKFDYYIRKYDIKSLVGMLWTPEYGFMKLFKYKDDRYLYGYKR